MIIETTNDALAAIGDAAVRERNDGEPVEFDENNRARVEADLGEFLVEGRESLSVYRDERDSDEEDQ